MSPEDLLDRRAVCAAFGGIHPATLYRHVRPRWRGASPCQGGLAEPLVAQRS